MRKLKVHSVSNSNGVVNMEALKAWRDYVGADHVLRHIDEYFLCETFKDAQLVEIDDHLVQHPVSKLDKEVSKPIEQALDLLHEAYQITGNKLFKLNEK